MENEINKQIVVTKVAKRKFNLELVLKRYNKIKLEKMAELLDFEDPLELERWILTLPDDYPMKIEEDSVIFEEQMVDQIDSLLGKFEEWETEGRGKKE